jgi:hypothetical protein
MTSRELPAKPETAFPVRVFPLGGEPGDDLSLASTAEERVAMVAILSARMWELTGQTHPAYTRSSIPVRVVPRL